MRWLYLLLVVFLVSCKSENKQSPLHIAVASNLQYVMQDIVQLYETETGRPCYVTSSSSGKLTAQIRSGAPYDIFLSADMDYPKILYELGLCTEAQVFAHGHLVLWSIDENIELNHILTENSRVAIANPAIAPYGRAAQSYLDKMKDGEIEIIKGESIAQVNQYIMNGAVDAGITSLSSVLAESMKNKGQWIQLDDKLYPALAHGYVSINRKGRGALIKDFENFLFSKSVQKLLEKNGYYR